MVPRSSSLRVTSLARVAALVVALVGLSLVLSQSAEAAGTFVPSGNTVSITFTSSSGPSVGWIFIFSGDTPTTGTCPAGGTFVAPYNATPDEAECSFAAAYSGPDLVTITLATAWSCTTPIIDEVLLNGDAGPILSQESAITCSAANATTTIAGVGTTTTTTTPPGTTTTTTSTSTSTTTQPPATTTTTTEGPCQCANLTVSLPPHTTPNVEHIVTAGGSSQSRIILKVDWALACTGGLGSCTGHVVIKSPSGGTTKVTGTAPAKNGGGGAGGGVHGKSSHRLPALAFYCGAKCGATTHGTFYVQWQFKGNVAGGSFTFAFEKHCNGLVTTQSFTLVYGSNGGLNRQASTLGDGRSG